MALGDTAAAAAGWAARGLLLKAAVAVALVAFVLLLVITSVGALWNKASAQTAGICGGPGTPGLAPGTGAVATDATLRAQQVAHAKTIDQVAAARGLSGRATLVALMTALQESTLLNLDHGDRDSLGLFQQRPSQGWGTPEQIMTPTYAAGAFFGGPEPPAPPGLVDLPGWESLPPGDVAQRVQRSAYPTLYAGHEGAAEQIAAEAGIDLDRAGTAPGPAGPPYPGDRTSAGVPVSDGGQCPQPPAGPAGAPFHDGAAGWPAEVTNPWSTEQAIAWARAQAAGGPDWYRLCLAFVARAYGRRSSGTAYAIDHYRQMPAHMRHDGDRNPPPGALLYWTTGKRAGHVALYLGGGLIASNDVQRPGYIDVVPVGDIEAKWRAAYAGWSPPYFPRGG
ncbi:C40 family peptidase (plasmid) [Streptomycetaceae bacterium NBC_01309]